MTEEAVIVQFKYHGPDLAAMYELEDRLSDAIADAGDGECDGHEITPDLTDATIYLYGPDAESLFAIAKQVFETSECAHDVIATLRFGPPEDGVPERTVRLP